jgi:hypothetical protein
MRPPLAGRREAARRVADEVLRRLAPVERVLRVPALGGRRRAAEVPAAEEPVVAPVAVTPEDAAARIDAARARLRARIEPPADD